MRNLTTFLSFLLSFFLCILGKTVYRPQQQNPLIAPLDTTKVPGQSPVYLCSLSPSDDLVDIKYINITPNPPHAGKNLTIDAMGILKIDIDEGAYANFEVKYGVIKLVSGTADICEKALEVELECPLKQGQIKVHKTVELPSHIPPGKYTVTGNVFTADDEFVTCLTATIFFNLGGNGAIQVSSSPF